MRFWHRVNDTVLALGILALVFLVGFVVGATIAALVIA